ncbi:S-adenosyl-L-methionine-dependent methyltransferase [Jimgerdemannia flammicorona]|uniref:type I protein arginine methyltransferase n=1 Tax=Jimgerdemannia flammicorona TaxID=994334 RepID=A0A433QZI3_9FUNG|nr:S-adenosyl-L-methionine-dependent methyltransferase [Jimgerdemannia flammicorona]
MRLPSRTAAAYEASKAVPVHPGSDAVQNPIQKLKAEQEVAERQRELQQQFQQRPASSSHTHLLNLPQGWRGPGPQYVPSEYTESELDPADNTWDDWEEDEENVQADPKCLFCAQLFPEAAEIFAHCTAAHGFDFLKTRQDLSKTQTAGMTDRKKLFLGELMMEPVVMRKLHCTRLNDMAQLADFWHSELDFYQSVRLINHIRRLATNDSEFENTTEFKVTGEEEFLQDDDLLRPVMEDDTLLYAFEDLDLDSEFADDDSTAAFGCRAVAEDEEYKPTTDLERELLTRLRATQEQLRRVEMQYGEYRAMVKTTFFDSMADDLRSERSLSLRSGFTGFDDDGNYYFNSYAHNEIHQSMLKDRVRTESYRDFIYENKDIFKGKTVLDVGCGTGILSMFAARSGAARIFSVDNSGIIEKAREIVAENGLSDVITLIRGRVEEITLPVAKVDIIISEWMGYFLLYEAMLDSVLVARDRFLAPGGILAPSQTRVLLAAIDDEDFKNDQYNFWDDVYGFKMSPMKRSTLSEAVVDFVKPGSIVTDIVTVKDLPLQIITKKQLDFSTPFKLVVNKKGTIHAFVGWFDTWFTRDGHAIPLKQGDEAKEGETFFTTGPAAFDTHWKQTVFVLEKGLDVEEGTALQGTFNCRKGFDNPRELDIEIRYVVEAPGEDVTETAGKKMVVQSFYLR